MRFSSSSAGSSGLTSMLCSRRLIVSRRTSTSWLCEYIDLDLATGKRYLDQTIGKSRPRLSHLGKVQTRRLANGVAKRLVTGTRSDDGKMACTESDAEASRGVSRKLPIGLAAKGTPVDSFYGKTNWRAPRNLGRGFEFDCARTGDRREHIADFFLEPPNVAGCQG